MGLMARRVDAKMGNFSDRKEVLEAAVFVGDWKDCMHNSMAKLNDTTSHLDVNAGRGQRRVQ